MTIVNLYPLVGGGLLYKGKSLRTGPRCWCSGAAGVARFSVHASLFLRSRLAHHLWVAHVHDCFDGSHLFLSSVNTGESKVQHMLVQDRRS